MSRQDLLLPTLVTEVIKSERKHASFLDDEDFQLSSLGVTAPPQDFDQTSDLSGKTFSDPRLLTSKKLKQQQKAKKQQSIHDRLFSIEDSLNALVSEEQHRDTRRAAFTNPDSDIESSTSDSATEEEEENPFADLVSEPDSASHHSTDTNDDDQDSSTDEQPSSSEEEENNEELEEEMEEETSEDEEPNSTLFGDVASLLANRSSSTETHNTQQTDDDYKAFVKEAKHSTKRTLKEIKRARDIAQADREERAKQTRSADEEAAFVKRMSRQAAPQDEDDSEQGPSAMELLSRAAEEKRRPMPSEEDSEGNEQPSSHKKSGKNAGKDVDMNEELAFSGDDSDESYDGLPFAPFSTITEDRNKAKNAKKISPSKAKRNLKRQALQQLWAKEHPYAAAQLGINQPNAKKKPTPVLPGTATPSAKPPTIVDGAARRRASKKILENKGDMKYYKKDRRNPRVFHRHRYERAIKKLRSRVPQVRERQHVYSGEETGINPNLVKSTSF